MILVTGATGHVGRAVVCRLASLGHDVVAMVRDVQAASRRLPSGIALRVADYEDASALKRALAGIDDMVLISSDGDASAVMRHHANAIEAATATNIRHITFTSIVDTDELSPFYFSPAYRDAERRLAVCSVPSTILRGCEGIDCIAVVRASRRALWALLSMREGFDDIKKIPHPEEAAKRLSRRTHRADPAQFQFFHTLESGNPRPPLCRSPWTPAFAGSAAGYPTPSTIRRSRSAPLPRT